VTGYPGTPAALTVTSSSLPESLWVSAPEMLITSEPDDEPSTSCVGPGPSTVYADGSIIVTTASITAMAPAKYLSECEPR
jgi:hypothetical protein